MVADVQMPKYAELYRPRRIDTEVNPADWESLPKIRWSPTRHRLEFVSPTAAQPGNNGFYMMQHIDNQKR